MLHDSSVSKDCLCKYVLRMYVHTHVRSGGSLIFSLAESKYILITVCAKGHWKI